MRKGFGDAREMVPDGDIAGMKLARVLFLYKGERFFILRGVSHKRIRIVDKKTTGGNARCHGLR